MTQLGPNKMMWWHQTSNSFFWGIMESSSNDDPWQRIIWHLAMMLLHFFSSLLPYLSIYLSIYLPFTELSSDFPDWERNYSLKFSHQKSQISELSLSLLLSLFFFSPKDRHIYKLSPSFSHSPFSFMEIKPTFVDFHAPKQGLN